MKTDLFDFHLPPERIALRPANPRESARLMVVRPGEAVPQTPLVAAKAGTQKASGESSPGGHWTPALAGVSGEWEDRTIAELPDLLQPGDCLVVNDSKVIAARLKGRRIGRGVDANIEATLHKRIDGSTWRAFIMGAKKVQPGDILRFGSEGRVCFLEQLDAEVLHKDEGGDVTLSFSLHGPHLDQAIEERGDMPLPPYIASKRPTDAQDKIDYQTLFAREDGSVAAPTAGLHFTAGLLTRLQARGVSLHKVTLHVGAGTFLPVKADDTAEHKMHAEFGVVTAETARALNEARAKGGRIVAVGSTALRTLETAASDDGQIHEFAGDTAIFITPGYRFKAVDLMMTNFHLPKSTLFMLVSAFSGLETMQAAYRHAIDTGYRFYSYGDACLLHPEQSFRDGAERRARNPDT